MENYPYSYPDSHDSSPRSRDNESWDDQQQPSSNYKVKFMCSYGGKIHPRPHDNQLAYVGGETKILSVDRNIKFSTIVSKLSSLSDYEVCFKYQLPGEDLDALISVTNEEDLEHMMLEYDRLYRGAGSRPARLRLFLFPINTSNQSSFSADDPKPSQQWFVDALNSVPSISSLDSSPPASATNADFLFGYEKQQQQPQLQPGNSPTVAKLMDPKPELPIQEPKIVIGSGSDVGRDDRNIGGESMFEIQRQIQELQRLQIVNQHEQQQQQQQQQINQQQQQAAMYQRKQQQAAYHGDYYMPEKPVPTGVPVPVPVSVPQTGYWQQQERQTTVTGGYSDQITGADRQQQQQQQQQPMYMMPSPAGMYQTTATNVRPVTGHVGHGYYGGMQGMQRVIPDVYREQPVYPMGPPPTQHQIQQPQAQMTKMMVGEGGGGGGGYTTAQVAYDNSGRQVYYTTGAPQQPILPPSYQTAVTTMSVVDPRQSGLNQDAKVVKPPQGSL
ncbi:hypothetical protein ACHQM5_016844 [Ranunculus cassubicifolius]